MGFRIGFGFLILGFGVLPVLTYVVGILTLGTVHGFVGDFFFVSTWPTNFCLYAAAAGFGWGFGFGDIRRSVAFGITICLALGLGVPALLNLLPRNEIAQYSKADRVTVPKIPASPQVIAVLTPPKSDGWSAPYNETQCTLFCQRLLYGGHRKAVLMGAAPKSGRPEDAVRLIRYSVEYRDYCPHVELPLASTLSKESAMWGSHTTSDRVSQLIENGHCLIAEPGDIADADVAGIWTTSDSSTWQAARSTSGTIASAREEVFVKQDGSWESLSRQSRSQGSVVAMPFLLQGLMWRYRPVRKDIITKSGTPVELSEDLFMNAMRPWMKRPV